MLLHNDDFIDGEFRALENNRVSISSVLFGLRYFERQRVRAIILHEIESGQARFEVLSRDGSRFLVQDLGLAKEAVVLQDGPFQGEKLALEKLVQIRRIQR